MIFERVKDDQTHPHSFTKAKDREKFLICDNCGKRQVNELMKIGRERICEKSKGQLGSVMNRRMYVPPWER